MQNSKIEWCDHTFNPWWGCQRVSPGCEHCYAETLAHRYNFKVWGPAKTTGRREMSANYWKQPIKWNREAALSGIRRRVFCASMADVFEDHPAVEWPRTNLWGLIETTPHLDWLLLTKRPENILEMLPPNWRESAPRNVWYGTSVENQKYADERIPHLLKVPARVRFLSCEPLLGPVDLGNVRGYPRWLVMDKLHWVIAGGESGPGARPMHPKWARLLRDQCNAAGVAFHFKQWGQFVPDNGDARGEFDIPYCGGDDPDGRTPFALPDGTITDLNWNGGPGPHLKGGDQLLPLGKGKAGRLLDGRTWDEFPFMARAPQGEERS